MRDHSLSSPIERACVEAILRTGIFLRGHARIPGRTPDRCRDGRGQQETPEGGQMAAQDNLELMKTLDDAWNAQDWDVFRKRHSADTAVYWPGQPDPTRGRDAHQAESEAFFKSIENHLENNPYRVMFGSGDWTCTIARWKGKMRSEERRVGKECRSRWSTCR